MLCWMNFMVFVVVGRKSLLGLNMKDRNRRHVRIAELRRLLLIITTTPRVPSQPFHKKNIPVLIKESAINSPLIQKHRAHLADQLL